MIQALELTFYLIEDWNKVKHRNRFVEIKTSFNFICKHPTSTICCNKNKSIYSLPQYLAKLEFINA